MTDDEKAVVEKHRLLQQKLVDAKRLLDEAKELAEELHVPLHFMGAEWCDYEYWTLKKRTGESIEWSESTWCMEYD